MVRNGPPVITGLFLSTVNGQAIWQTDFQPEEYIPAEGRSLRVLGQRIIIIMIIRISNSGGYPFVCSQCCLCLYGGEGGAD